MAGPLSLHNAAQNGDIERVASLIKEGVDINRRDNQGRSAADIAISEGYTQIAKLLLGEKVDGVSKIDNMNRTLLVAAKEGQLEIVKNLIDNSANIHIEDGSKFTPLHQASRFGHSEVVRYLLGKGAQVDSRGQHRETPLFMAITSGYNNKFKPEVIKLLIDNGSNIEAIDDQGWTPLYAAAQSGNVEAAKILIDKGASVNKKTNFGQIPLHRAVIEVVRNGLAMIPMIILLLEEGADIEIKTRSKGETALQIAERECRGPTHFGEWHKEEVRTQVLSLLGQTPSPENDIDRTADKKINNNLQKMDKLFNDLAKGSSRSSFNAAEKLISIGSPVVDRLILILQNKEVSVKHRKHAAYALGRIGDKRAVEPLTEIIHGWGSGLEKRKQVRLKQGFDKDGHFGLYREAKEALDQLG